jgi:hypothetical protein
MGVSPMISASITTWGENRVLSHNGKSAGTRNTPTTTHIFSPPFVLVLMLNEMVLVLNEARTRFGFWVEHERTSR